MSRSRSREEGGQLLPLVALVMVLVAGGCLVIAKLGGAALLRARAVTAADAAALAGAVAGERAAREVAAANGARVESLERVGPHRDVRVQVALGPARASARARPPERSDVDGVVPALRAALDAAGRLLGRPVPVTSGYRSRQEQASLFARRHLLPYPVAPPGRSAHERGMAVDVSRSFVPTLLRVASRVGLCRPYAARDPVHFELCRVPGPRAGAG